MPPPKLTTKSVTPQKRDPARLIIDLLKLLVSTNVETNALINYVEQNNIDVNTYLPSIDGRSQLPLIYYCCSNTQLSEFFLYLIDKGVNVRSQMVCENESEQIELLYYSQTQYIQLLVENGCTVNQQKVEENVEKLILRGNITKLITMYKYRCLNKESVEKVVHKEGIIFKILDFMYGKIYSLSQSITDQNKFNQLYEEIVKNYINTFKFLIKNGVNINQMDNGESLLQKVLNTYFKPLIVFVMECQPNINSEELLHYSNFNLINRGVMKFIYSEENYAILKKILDDKMSPKKINIKKNVVRKVVNLKK